MTSFVILGDSNEHVQTDYCFALYAYQCLYGRHNLEIKGNVTVCFVICGQAGSRDKVR